MEKVLQPERTARPLPQAVLTYQLMRGVFESTRLREGFRLR